jgi:hypothetical protein
MSKTQTHVRQRHVCRLEILKSREIYGQAGTVFSKNSAESIVNSDQRFKKIEFSC